jgi:hypothetical protein
LAEEGRELESQPVNEDDEKLRSYLNKLWYVSREDLENVKKKQEAEFKLDRLLSDHPDLKKYENAIRTIWEKDTSAWEDIVVKYWFKDKQKLHQRTSDVVWSPKLEKEPQKSISEMTPAEYKKWAESRKWTTSKWSR